MMAHAKQSAPRRLEVGAAGSQRSARAWRALFASTMCWFVLLASACTGGPHPEPPFTDPSAAGGAGTGAGLDGGVPPLVGTGGVGGGGGVGGSAGTEMNPPTGGSGVDHAGDDDAGIEGDDAGALH